MHFHLPKPLHGWREFAGEVGIIVLGVLIALSAEQVVEGLHMRSETEAGETAFKYPIRGTFVGCCAWTEKLSGKSKAQGTSLRILLVRVLE